MERSVVRSKVWGACIGLLLSASSWGQTLSLPDNPQAPTELARPQFLPPATASGFQLPSLALPEVPLPQPASQGVVFSALVIRGNAAIATQDLLDVARPWHGQPLQPSDLEALRLAITRHYVERGYVNSGALLQVQGGTVVIDVVEGRLSQLHFSGLEGLDERYLRSRLWPDATAPLQLEVLRERYQLLLDDPLLQRMNAQLQPGPEPGSAVLEVAVERAAPWSFSARLHNHRAPSVGEQALTLEGGYRNLTGRGDALRLTLQPDHRSRGLARLGLGWSVPVVYPSTVLSLQYDAGDSSMVEEPLASADVRSRLVSHEAGLSHLLWEDLRHRAATGLTWAYRRNETSIAGMRFPFVAGVPEEGLRSHAVRWWLEYTHRSQTQVLALRSTFTQTRNNLLPVVGAASRRSHFWLGQAQFARRLGQGGVQAVARATVQHTTDALTGLDGLSIGGASSVRGWRENQLVRDRGVVLNLELEIPLSQPGHAAGQWHLIPFVDYGRGRNVQDAADAIGSVGLALRWRQGRWSADAAWGWRAYASVDKARAGHALQDYGLHFQLAYAMGR